ncbi:MAG: hypothetical protein JWM39_73 [Parcubacteria group bacterium]|nr:hypothetical protein [Parcubacteria group bacterium]
MIELGSPEWAKLPDAYNNGENISSLLKQLEADPGASSENNAEPWASLWSGLCHQGDVYPASFAAVPHLAEIAARTSQQFARDMFVLPAFIEMERARKNIEVPEELATPYHTAIKELARLAAHYIGQEHLDADFLAACEGMVLIGEGKLTEARKVLDPDAPK